MTSLSGTPTQSVEKMLDSMFRLDGRIAVVTGGTGRLGFEIADALASAGCHVVITSRAVERAEKAAAVLRQRRSVEVLALPLELSEYRSIAQFADQAHSWRGRIDVLVNNAGGGSGKKDGNLFVRDPAEIAATIATNLTATI